MSATQAGSLASASPARIDWNPYLMGAGIGLPSVVVFALFNKPLGITTEFSAAASLVAEPFMGAEAVAANPYWKATPFAWSYGTFFLVGVVLGGALSALSAGRWRIETVPAVWAERFGGSVAVRFVGAFVVGAIAMFGARLAGGCTSGHAISGGLQLALSSWLFLAVMFASGLLTARILYGRN